ncbi:hypothetical protein DAMA08_050190 [Martiniozyma asiatica (nom. inval.)]|nr:hypothetical protein DAMA08_050190 [Martiniozyma asiatica]
MGLAMTGSNPEITGNSFSPQLSVSIGCDNSSVTGEGYIEDHNSIGKSKLKSKSPRSLGPKPASPQLDTIGEQPLDDNTHRGSIWQSVVFWQSKEEGENTANNEETHLINNESILWTIPRAIPASVTTISGIFQSVKNEEIIQFQPNTFSQVIQTNVNSEPVITPINSNIQDKKIEVSDTTWSFPWSGWFGGKVNEDQDKHVVSPSIADEPEGTRLFRKLVTNAIECLSYGLEKPVGWGLWKRDGEELGEVRLTGNKSCRKGVKMLQLPKSNFENTESQLKKNANTVNKEDKSSINDDKSLKELNHGSIVLPTVRWSYRDLTIKTKTRITLSGLTFFQNIFSPQTHLYFDSQKYNPKKKPVKKAVVIAFHGFVPLRLSKIINESSESSTVMVNEAVNELNRWATLQNVDIEIDTMELEGYGKLFERVNDSMSILDNWSSCFHEMDYVFVVANSHSVSVAVHVLAKMISSGYMDHIEKLGLLAISGICLGPIAEIESKVSTRGINKENDMISEMFDLGDPETLPSKELIRDFKVLVRKNCKVSFVGNLNDSFTPLYSSLCLHMNHPNIYRMVYIDGSTMQPDFIVSLFNLLLTVRNLNYTDHSLLIELSKFFEGKPGDGLHNCSMNDKDIYRYAISNMLDTTDLIYRQEIKTNTTNSQELSANNYHIPWCLRGFIEELDKLRFNFEVDQMLDQLYAEFVSWVPNEQQKELKYCIEAFEASRRE